jgi:hypothetical protein
MKKNWEQILVEQQTSSESNKRFCKAGKGLE